MSNEPERITQESVTEIKKEVAVKQKSKLEKPYKCEFPGCDRVFKSRAGLASHVRAAHELEEGKESAVSDSDKYRTKVDEVKKRLEDMPKMMFIIPLGPGEKPGASIEVGINGYFMSYPKGKYFEAPKPVIDLIKNYIESQSGAGAAYKIDPSNPDDKGKEIQG